MLLRVTAKIARSSNIRTYAYSTMAHASLNQKAQELKALHQPGNPVILANVWDVSSARTVGSLPSAKALATASFAVASANNTSDDALTLEINLSVAKEVGKVAAELDKPLTIDLQDGYGPRLEEAISSVIAAGAVGVNLEDVDKETGVQYSPADAVDRITRALAAAKKEGVPDFVVNARCDTLLRSTGPIEEAFSRGKKYLDAGATTVFVLGGGKRGGLTADEVKQLTKQFEGRLNVSVVLADGKLSAKEVGEIGVSRISVGPQLYFKEAGTVKAEAEKLLSRS